MKTTAELKKEAKVSLRGKWGNAVLLNLIPTLIMAAVLVIIGIPILLMVMKTTIGNTWIHSFPVIQQRDGSFPGTSLIGVIISTLFMSGISWTYLELIRGTKTRIHPLKDALRGFQRPFLVGVILLALTTNLFISLWTLVLIIPGIIKMYAYSQSYFIYYDHINKENKKNKTFDTITASRYMMKGYKRKLFWLDLTFVGWHIVATLTFGIGYLWLNPYISATKAAFYENLLEEHYESSK
jgi:uncharacterized membrane protein